MTKIGVVVHPAVRQAFGREGGARSPLRQEFHDKLISHVRDTDYPVFIIRSPRLGEKQEFVEAVRKEGETEESVMRRVRIIDSPLASGDISKEIGTLIKKLGEILRDTLPTGSLDIHFLGEEYRRNGGCGNAAMFSFAKALYALEKDLNVPVRFILDRELCSQLSDVGAHAPSFFERIIENVRGKMEREDEDLRRFFEEKIECRYG